MGRPLPQVAEIGTMAGDSGWEDKENSGFYNDSNKKTKGSGKRKGRAGSKAKKELKFSKPKGIKESPSPKLNDSVLTQESHLSSKLNFMHSEPGMQSQDQIANELIVMNKEVSQLRY